MSLEWFNSYFEDRKLRRSSSKGLEYLQGAQQSIMGKEEEEEDDDDDDDDGKWKIE